MAKKLTKPSQVWVWAAKNLEQGEGSLKNIRTDTYCALGAIGKYMGMDDGDLEVSAEDQYKEIMAFDNIKGLNEDLFTIFGEAIIGLNDADDWSFEMFADVAKRLGY